MNKKNIETFVNSDHRSIEEQSFLDSTMNQYYNKKQRLKYEQILAEEYNIQAPEGKFDPHKVKSNKHILRNSIIIGISIILIGFSIFFIQNMNNDTAKTPVQYASLDNVYIELAGATRGVETEMVQAIKNMSSAYTTKNFDEVLENYNLIDDKSGLQESSIIEAAVAFANTGSNSKAIELLSALMANSSDARQQELRWTLINLYLISNNRVQAEKIFGQMKASDYKFNESKALLSK